MLILLFWLFTQNKKYALISLIPILFTFPFLHRTFTLSTHSNNQTGIKIISYNVRNFDLYNWSHNKDTRQKMFNLLESEQPDILCLQEFYSDTVNFDNIDDLKKTLGFKYYHYGKTASIKGKRGLRTWGIITFSKYPIVEKDKIDFNNSTGNSCIFTDIQVEDSVIRIYNLHMQSIHFGYSDYKYLDQVEENQTTNQEKTQNILRKIKNAAKKRGEQVDKVVSSINACSYAKIICGDFNDPPVSYTYQNLSKNMTDAHVQNGFGFGRTYSKIIPTLRIDYLLFDPMLRVNSYQVIDKDYSDHYPIISTFSIQK